MKNLKKNLKICLPIFLMILGIEMPVSILRGHNMNQAKYQDLSNDDKMLYSFINRQGQMLANKYHMRQCATGIGGRDKVWLIALSFDKCGDPMAEGEARQLIVNCVDDLLDAVNKEEKLRLLIENYPFTAKNLEMRIFSRDKNRKIHYFPYIAIVSDNRGEIGFLTKIPSSKYGYHTEKYETYEESVAILKGENQHKGPENNIE